MIKHAATKRKDEDLCKDAFVLHATSLGHDVAVVPGVDGEAPDYFAWLDGREHCLEVTMLMDSVTVAGTDPKPRAQATDHMAKLRGAIERRMHEIAASGYLFVGIYGDVMPNLVRRQGAIVDAATAFIQTEGAMAARREVAVALDGHGEIVRFVHDATMPTRVVVGQYSFLPDDYQDPVPALRTVMATRISKKRQGLTSDRRPRILALGGVFIPAAPKHYRLASKGIDIDDFAAVLVVHSKTKVQVLRWDITSPPARVS